MPSFRPNISNDLDTIIFECNSNYDTIVEVTKWFLQIAYLIPGGILNILLLYTILFKNSEIYASSSFFLIYSTDCFVSFSMIFLDIIGRTLVYFTPLCPIIAPMFYEPLIGFKIMMIVLHHSRACKSLIQILLVVNRMSCVIYFIRYGKMWMRPLKYLIILVFVIPFSIDWNLIISRVYMQPTFGGIYMEYIKKVAWASQSRFQLIFITIALLFTIVCTSVIFYTLVMLPKRLRNVERTLSLGTAYISMSFIILVVFQTRNSRSPIIMHCVSSKLRNHVLRGSRKLSSAARVVPVSNVTSTNGWVNLIVITL
nr:chemosensory receptor [Caenorhabditis elegans]